jgi:hypothetical protein
MIRLGLCFFLIVGLTSQDYAQSKKCGGPMNNFTFQQKLGDIGSHADLNQRFSLVKQIATHDCLSSDQLRQLAILLGDDQQRLEVCKLAYPRITDKENFYSAYDAFNSFSVVMRLHDFVLNPQTTTSSPGPASVPAGRSFPNLTYPDASLYLGKTGCDQPISVDAFNGHADALGGKMNDQAKLQYAKHIVTNNCVTTDQVMKMATFLSTESMKLDLLQTAYMHIYDKSNYEMAKQVFSLEGYRRNFLTFLYGVPEKRSVTESPKCAVPDTEVDAMILSIEKESYSNRKMGALKPAIAAKQCFTAAQIKRLVGILVFEDNKLEMAMYAYEFCIDRENYYVVNEALTFTESKEELKSFLLSKK